MPRYLFETAPLTAHERDRAHETASRRCPEVVVEHVYAAHDDTTTRHIWVCRAPSDVHIKRWAAAAGLAPRRLRHIEADGRQPLNRRAR